MCASAVTLEYVFILSSLSGVCSQSRSASPDRRRLQPVALASYGTPTLRLECGCNSDAIPVQVINVYVHNKTWNLCATFSRRRRLIGKSWHGSISATSSRAQRERGCGGTGEEDVVGFPDDNPIP